MKIHFEAETSPMRFDGHPAICIIFENNATQDQLEDATGTSWQAIQDYMFKAGAIAEAEQRQGIIKRKLWFRAYGRKQGR